MRIFFLIIFVAYGLVANAQDQLLNVARQYLSTGDYEKAASTYKQLVEYNPDDDVILKDYIKALMGLKDYATAEKLLKQKLKSKTAPLFVKYELGKVYKLNKEDKKANKLFDDVVESINTANESVVRPLAVQFATDGFLDYAVSCYQRAKTFDKEMPFLYAEELALLYDKQGNQDKAIESLLDVYASRPDKGEEVKATLMRLADKPEKVVLLRKKIETRMKQDEQNIAYPDLIAWMYIQQGDYETAFTQIKTIDDKLKEQGRRVLGFGRVCLREKQYAAALKSYDYVIQLGDESPFVSQAQNEKLTTLYRQLQNNPNRTKQEVQGVCSAYETFFEANPIYKGKETIRDYADLQAKYAHDIEKAIAILSDVVNRPNLERSFRGRCKLDMGDYELIRNNIWESTLLYSQVDKDFKQDILGEEARFRNAKLSYYSGDFEWAQGQLDVLKASTSELIANDALNLSILITENNPPADSNVTPLLMYARADLLEFQNKDAEAIEILDSIINLYPKHPLRDDIYMQRAKMALKVNDYNEAGMYYQKVLTNHSDDVLADDALFKLAFLNEEQFSNKDEAKRLYQELIVKYPGSTFINEARKRFRVLRGDAPDVEIP